MTEFDIQKFQAEVDAILKSNLSSISTIIVSGDQSVAIGGDVTSSTIITGEDNRVSTPPPEKSAKGTSELFLINVDGYLLDTDIPAKPVKKALKNTQIKKYLCPVLKSISGDAYEFSKIITPILVSLSLAGTVAVSLNPVIFAGIAIVVTRMGVAAFCADCPDDAKPKEKK